MMMKLLFSAQGRINRKKFWAAGLGWMAAILVDIAAYGLVVGMGGDQPGAAGIAGLVVLSLISIVLLPAWVVSSICLGIKRYHDLGKPGVWVLMAGVPVVGHLWYFIEAGCTRGTVGSNLYGSDPLGGSTSFGGPAPFGGRAPASAA